LALPRAQLKTRKVERVRWLGLSRIAIFDGQRRAAIPGSQVTASNYKKDEERKRWFVDPRDKRLMVDLTNALGVPKAGRGANRKLKHRR
jgi:hypothetical protein